MITIIGKRLGKVRKDRALIVEAVRTIDIYDGYPHEAYKADRELVVVAVRNDDMTL